MMTLGFIASMIGCDSNQKDGGNTTGTTTETGDEPIYTDRGPDCEAPATDADRRATVLVPDECATIQSALEIVQCTDGYISVASDAVIPATSDFSATGTCGTYENLTIGSDGETPAYLHPTALTDTTMMRIYGTHSVLMDNLYADGFGLSSALEVGSGAAVEVDNSTFHDVLTGVSVYDGTYLETGNTYDLVYGTALYAGTGETGTGADVTMENAVINGQVQSDGPMIHAEGAASVLVYGVTIANSETLSDTVSIQADYARVYDGLYFDNVTNGYVLNVLGGDPMDELGAETDNQVYNNVVANNRTGTAGVAKFDASGEMTVANNTFANNDSKTTGFNTVIDLTDESGDGITTFTNNVIAYHDGLASEEITLGFGTDNVDVSYNTFTGNGVASIPQDDEVTNADCDPFEDGSLLDMFVYDELYMNAYEYAHEDDNACLDSTGNPESKFNNPGENVSDRGAFGGKYLNGLIEQADLTDLYSWFGETE